MVPITALAPGIEVQGGTIAPMTDASVADPAGRRDSAEPRATVLAIDTDWNSASGGITTFNRRLCIALAGIGVQVYCLVLKATPEEIREADHYHVTLLAPERLPGETAHEALRSRLTLPYGPPTSSSATDSSPGPMPWPNGAITSPAPTACTSSTPRRMTVSRCGPLKTTRPGAVPRRNGIRKETWSEKRTSPWPSAHSFSVRRRGMLTRFPKHAGPSRSTQGSTR